MTNTLSPATPWRPLACDLECDVLVAGSGASGLTAALTARHHGLDVHVIEKDAFVGGCTAFSHGMLWIPGNPLAASDGLADSRDAALAYLQGEMGASFEEARTELEDYLEHAPRMLDFVQRVCGVRFEVNAGFPDYHSERPGAAAAGRTLLPLSHDARRLGERLQQLRPPRATLLGMSFTPAENRQINTRSRAGIALLVRRFARHLADVVRHGRTAQLAGGNALMAGLLAAAGEIGVPVHTQTRLHGLTRESGRVTGGMVEAAGRPFRVRARRGVLLACGGFGQDAARCAAWFPHPPLDGRSWSFAPAGCDGDGMRLAIAAGAAPHTDVAQVGFWTPTSRLPGVGAGRLSTHSHDRMRPGFLAVTPEGRRFANEADSNHHFCEAMLRATPAGRAPQAWLVCDHAALRRTGVGDYVPGAPFPVNAHVRSGYLLRAPRLAQLAQAMGMDPLVLCATVDRFNDGARRGHDPDFGRGSTRFNRALGQAGHQPNPCMGPLEHGPFYAVRMTVGHMATLAGLRADADGRALDEAGAPIAGLYVLGNDRVNVFRGACPGGGVTLGPGMTWAYRTALGLARAGEAPLPLRPAGLSSTSLANSPAP